MIYFHLLRVFSLLLICASTAFAWPEQALTTLSMSELCGDGIDNDNTGGDATCTSTLDNDRDGYENGSGAGEDCDDTDRWVYPGVQQTCGTDGTQTCETSGSFSSCAEGELDESTASGTAYYIDPTSGNNSNNGLTRATAWADFDNIKYYYDAGDQPVGYVGLTAGDVVYIMSGTINDWYDVGGGWGYKILMLRNIDGTASDPIIIKPYPGESPVIDGASDTNERTMFHLEGTDYVKIQNLKFSNATGNGIYVETATGNEATGNFFDEVEVEISPSGASGAIKFSTVTDGVIAYNMIRNSMDDGGGGRNSVAIRGFYGTVDVHHNVLFNDTTFGATTTGEGIQIKHGTCDTGNWHIYENIILNYSGSWAIASASPNTTVEDNFIYSENCVVFHDVGGPNQQKNMYVRRNTCDGGMLLRYEPSKDYCDNTIGTLDITANVVDDDTSSYSGNLGVIDIQRYSGGDADALYTELVTGGKITSDGNCFYNSGTTLQFSTYPNATAGDDRTFAQWQSTDGFDANSFVEAPSFDSNFEASSTNCDGLGWVLPVTAGGESSGDTTMSLRSRGLGKRSPLSIQ